MITDLPASAPVHIPDYLAGGGEVGALIRAHDWAATPLGPPEGWPQALRMAISICLHSSFPTAIYWGPELRLLYNDAWAPIPAERHPWALGRPGAEVWADIWDVVGPQFARVIETGEGFSTFDQMLPMVRGGIPRETYWNYSFTPIRGDDGTIVGILNQGHETTDRVLNERRQTLRLVLEERLRDLADPLEITAAAAEMLGRHLHASRVGYAEIDAAGCAVVERDWTAAGVASVTGRLRVEDFGQLLAAELKAGRTVRVDDSASDRLTAADGTVQAFAAIAVRSTVDVPLVKDGRFVAVLFVHAAEPRRWSDDEVALIEEVADRTWAAVERARAEMASHESEARWRGLFTASPTPIAVLAPDSPRFTIIELNDAYLANSSRTREALVGRGVFEAFPDNPDDPGATGVANLRASLDRTLASRKPDAMPVQKYDVARPDGGFEERWWDSRNSPVLDHRGEVEAIVHHVTEVTGKFRAEAALRESEARLLFMSSLDEALRASPDAPAAMLAAAELLARHLGASRCAYADVDPDNDRFIIRDDFRAPEVASSAGTYSLDLFGPRAAADMRSGNTLVIRSIPNELAPGEGKEMFQAIGIEAVVCCPLIKDGRLVAMMAVHQDAPRDWQADEIAVTASVAERCWSQVERVGAEARLRESEAKFHAIANSIDQMVWSTRPDGFHDYYNQRWYDFTGVPQGSTDGEEWNGVFHPEDQERAWAHWRHSLQTGEPYEIEYRLRHCSGGYRWVLGRAQCIRDAAGRITRWFGTCTDIQEIVEAREVLGRYRQELERQVEERTAERDRMWETSPDLMVVIDFEGVFRRVNPAWTTLLGYAPDELVGHHVNEFVIADDHSKTVDAYELAASGGRPVIQNRYRHKDGSVRWISWVAAPAGDVTYAMGRDITAEKQRQAELEAAQEALRQSQKMEAMGQLTGGVAHDFNNLLTPIVGSLDLLQRKGLGGEREQRLIDGALQSAERAKTLVQRLLAFARRQPLQPSAVDVGKLVHGMADLLSSTTGPQVRVVVEVADDLPPAKADPNQLEMALLNLGVNARDAMPEGGTLRISATRESRRKQDADLDPGHYVRLSVADTGLGMDEATLARAVEPFFSTKGIGKGTGLGLSMAHGLAAQLGGALTIQSRPGVGTNVEFWLPISAVPLQEPEPRSELSEVGGKAGLALLVDDEPIVRASTADMLADLGYRVREADSAEAALALVNDGCHPDLLVTDHLMPGMSGVELVRALRDLHPHLPALIVSGYAEMDGIAPDLPRLIKPFRHSELAARLSELDGAAAC